MAHRFDRIPRVPRRRVLAGTAGAVLASTASSFVAAPAAETATAQGRPGGPGTLVHHNPPVLSTPRGYSHVVEATGVRTIYVSGQVPVDRTGALVGPGDLRRQTQQVFENIRAAIRAAGATFADVVKLNYYVLDASQVQVIRDVRDTFLDASRPPASTLVEVRRLVREEFLVEIDAIANVRG